MRFRGALLVSAVLLSSVAGTGSAVAAQPGSSDGVAPAAGWAVDSLGAVNRDPCVPWYTIAKCTRYGGLAATGDTVLLLDTDGGSLGELGTSDYAQVRRSTNGGGSFGAVRAFSTSVEGPDTTKMPAMAQLGSEVAVVYEQDGSGKPVRVRRSTNLGQTFGAETRLPRPRQVITNLAIAKGPADRVAVAIAAYDEADAGRPPFVVDVHVSNDDGATFPVTKRFTLPLRSCFYLGTDPSIAIAQDGTIVLAYWPTCSKLVVTRSTNGGASWSSPVKVSDGPHTQGMAIAAQGSTVVLAYTAGGDTRTRRSTDSGATWAAPAAAGSGAESLRLAYAGGIWRLLSGGTDRIRYRTSSVGASWSAGESVFESIGSRTYAIGITYATAPLAAFVVRTPDKTTTEYVATR